MSRLHNALALALAVPLFAGLPGCDSDKKDDKKADAKKDDAKKDDAKKADAKKEDTKKPEPKTLAPGKVELPWTFERVSGAIEMGMVITYDLSGTGADGKEVKDQYKCTIKKASDDEVGTVCNTVEKPSKDKGAGQVAKAGWTQFSPLFTVERPSHELKARENVTTPMGEFDCVVADIKGFFGNSYTVWMIVDKPGLYAKVVKHANPAEEKDKTNLTYVLASVTTKE